MTMASPPNMEMIRQIETGLSLPAGARQLETYVRYFATENVAGVHTIVGIFVHDRRRGRIMRVLPDQLPQIEDGGCDVIEMRYSPKAGKVLSIFCHGVA